jgi:hypothetical protein
LILPKNFFLYSLVIRFRVRFRNIRKIDIAVCCVLILLKHRIDRRAELNRILLVNVISVYLEVLQSISSSLFRVELYLLLPSLAFPCAGFCVLKTNFLLSPSVRKYYVSRDIAAGRFAKDNLVVRFLLQEVYKNHSGGSRAILG